jgi:hypothetical protein
MNNPFGKYGQLVAASVAIAIIGAYLFTVVFGELARVPITSVDRLQVLALIAIGAVFGSAATINGVKAPLDSAHHRIDKLETGTGIATHGAYPLSADETANITQHEIERRIGT